MFKKLNEENDDFVLGNNTAIIRAKKLAVWEIIARANALLITAENIREKLEDQPESESLQNEYAVAVFQYEDYLSRTYVGA